MSWAPAQVVFWQVIKPKRSHCRRQSRTLSSVRTKKINFLLILSSEFSCGHSLAEVLYPGSSCHLWALQVIPDHGKTPGMFLQWNWAGWGGHPYPTGVPGRGDSHSLGFGSTTVSNCRRYWKDHFLQVNSTGGWWAEVPSHLLCTPKRDSIIHHGGIFWNMLLRRLYSSLSAGFSICLYYLICFPRRRRNQMF